MRLLCFAPQPFAAIYSPLHQRGLHLRHDLRRTSAVTASYSVFPARFPSSASDFCVVNAARRNDSYAHSSVGFLLLHGQQGEGPEVMSLGLRVERTRKKSAAAVCGLNSNTTDGSRRGQERRVGEGDSEDWEGRGQAPQYTLSASVRARDTPITPVAAAAVRTAAGAVSAVTKALLCCASAIASGPVAKSPRECIQAKQPTTRDPDRARHPAGTRRPPGRL